MIDVPMKTVDIIVNKKPVWCYTLNYKTKEVKERIGKIPFIYYYKANFKDDNDPRKWATWTLNSLSLEEGAVRGATVWYDHPNLEGAVEAFRDAGRKIAIDYSMKAGRSMDRVMKLNMEGQQ